MNNGTKNKKLTFLSAHLEDQYGKTGTAERAQYEEGFEGSNWGAMIQELKQ